MYIAMLEKFITDSIVYIGVDDRNIDLFESQYVVPHGVSYNSYVILDEKIAVMDTVDARMLDEWFPRLEAVLDGRQPDYLVVSHMEPDHAAGIAAIAERYPDMKIVGNLKTFTMISQFFGLDLSDRAETVKEGSTLSLGKHTLQFLMAPMVHWPEVMVTYDQYDRALFSADAFGKFGTLDTDEEWTDEARRYYFNIVGKYGAQVQALLRKVSALDVSMILPLHGPVLKENLGYYTGKYDTWSRYEPEEKGVFIAVASIYGHTMRAARELASMLEERGVAVRVCDLAREDMAEAVGNAFRYSAMAVASSSYDAGLFPPMEHFLMHLRDKGFRNRRVAVIENGSWAPSACKHMLAMLEAMKDLDICEKKVSIRSSHNDGNLCELSYLSEWLSE